MVMEDVEKAIDKNFQQRTHLTGLIGPHHSCKFKSLNSYIKIRHD